MQIEPSALATGRTCSTPSPLYQVPFRSGRPSGPRGTSVSDCAEVLSAVPPTQTAAAIIHSFRLVFMRVSSAALVAVSRELILVPLGVMNLENETEVLRLIATTQGLDAYGLAVASQHVGRHLSSV